MRPRSKRWVQLHAIWGSPRTGLLGICLFSFLYCIAQTFHAYADHDGGPECAQGGDDGFDPADVCFCPRETVCLKTTGDLVLLTLARSSAYFDYPLYVMLFVSKARNLLSFFRRTYLSVWLPLDDLHSLHAWAGVVVGIEVMWHSFWHMLRWGFAGDMRLLTGHTTGISGLLSLSVTPLIVLPMCLRRLRRSISFEVRKTAHYLAVVWGVAICFHAPAGNIAWIMGSAVGVYALDFLFGLLFQTKIIDTMQFTRFGSAVEVRWEAHEDMMEHWTGSGYIYLCLPWVSKSEWHAFSLFRHPTHRNCLCVCMAITGDWTKAVHKALKKPSARPGWVYGPFPSPFSTGVFYDNLVAVGTGIGITAALASVASLNRRHVHLVWMCRDPDLVEFYVKNALYGREDSWTFVFYTGERTPVLGSCLATGSRRVKIFFKRPNLHDVLLAIINNASCGIPLPDELMEGADSAEKRLHIGSPDVLFHYALERAFATYSMEELFELGLDLSHNATNITKAVRPFMSPFPRPVQSHSSYIQVPGRLRRRSLQLPGMEDEMPDACPWEVPAPPSPTSSRLAPPSSRLAWLMEEDGSPLTVGGGRWRSKNSACSSDNHHPRSQQSAADIRRESITARGFLQMVRQICQSDDDSESGGMPGDEQIEEHFAIGDMEGKICSVQGLDAALGSLRWAASVAADEAKQAVEASQPASPIANRQLPNMFEPTGSFGRQQSPDSARGDLREASADQLARWTSSWQIMYCGGAGAVRRTLEGFGQRYGVPIKIENQNW